MSEGMGAATRAAATAVAILVGVAVGSLALLVAGMRWELPLVLDAVRRLNRTTMNPRVMRTAGTAGTQTSIIEHVGRKSGRAYETPIDVIAAKTGFLIALPYGTRADWVRNVVASGSATVVANGERIDVDRPTILATSDVADLIPRRTLRTLRLFGVKQCLHLENHESG
jgi:deazaflavin-dependent oxidoreductase (nitroreductase family)